MGTFPRLYATTLPNLHHSAVARRRQIAIEAARARWEKIGSQNELPVVSHKGPLKIGNVAIDAYRLKDGRRVISKKGMAQALALKSSGGNAFLRSLTRPGLRSEIDQKLWETIENPIFFSFVDPDSEIGPGATGDGYEATTLIDVCKAIIDAQQTGKLQVAMIDAAAEPPTRRGPYKQKAA